jgi:hypothetical protein
MWALFIASAIPAAVAQSLVPVSTCDMNMLSVFISTPRPSGESQQLYASRMQEKCTLNLMEIKKRNFFPPHFWDKFVVGCKNECLALDEWHRSAREASGCTCEELGTCESSAASLMCRTIWSCMDELYYRLVFCDGCGTGQPNEELYWEEKECGGASALLASGMIFVVCLVVSVMTNHLYLL